MKVWHKSIDFADKVIELLENLNSNRKHFRIIEQIESASTSVSSNIAEGKGRYSKKEFVQYLYISRGSLNETISLLNVLAKRKWITLVQLESLEKDGIEIVGMIKALINAISETK